MKIYDITKTIKNNLSLWPGDHDYKRHESTYKVNDMTGHASWIEGSLHMGTHVDAHYHYSQDGLTIDEHDLSRYIGRCQVVDVTQAQGPHIECIDLPEKITERRIIFKTDANLDESKWKDHFKGISVEVIEYLNEQGVFLIGLDSPSVDLYNVGEMSSHLAFYKYDMYIIEGLNLNTVPEGIYQLTALPLKIEGADGSPIRAVLTTF